MLLLYLGSVWLLGICLASLFQVSTELIWLATLLPAAVVILRWRNPPVRLASACCLALLLGALRFNLSIPQFDERSLAHYNNMGRMTLKGVVVAEPDIRDQRTNLLVDAYQIQVEDQGQDIEGTVLVQASRYPRYVYGDELEISGLLETPPEFEDFSYRDYLANRGIYSILRRPQVKLLAHGQGNPLYAALLAFKARAQATITQILPEPEASLLTGILLGVEGGIPPKLVDSFNATSTSHVIAISGFNLSLLSGIFAQLGRRLLGKRFSVLFAVASIALYTLFVGANAAVVRAAIMSILYVIAIHFGRRSEALTALITSGVLMTLIRPQTLFDVGFQLSFAATLGLILYTPLVENWLVHLLSRLMADETAKKVLTVLNDVFTVTLAAQLFVLPIVVYYFRRLSLIGQLTNFLVLPVQSGVIIWGGIATLLGLVYLPLGQIASWVVWLFLTWTIRVVGITAQVPYASIAVGRPSPLFILLYYGLLLGLWLNVQETYPFPKIPWHYLTRHLTAKVTLLALSGAAILTWSAVFSLPDGYLHVFFFDVGQGDSIFIESPRGCQILIDGGPSPAALLSALGKEMPFWDRSLDVVVMTHPDEDHIGGLVGVLERYQVGRVLNTTLPYETATARQLADTIQDKNVPVELAQRGMRISLDEGLWLEVLHPGETLLVGTEADDNNNSIVLRLVYRQASFLLTGDVAEEAEQELIQSGQPLRSLVLKVSHHGAKTSSSAPFLEAVRPQVAVIQVGAENRFGHPAPEVLNRLENTTVFRTDQQGTVEVVTDGEKYWVSTER